MTQKTWKPLDVIFLQGEDGEEFFLVMAGNAEVRTKMVGDKQDRVIATLHAGDYFGEGAIVRSEPRGATVTAQSDLVTLSLTQSQFDELGFKDVLIFPTRRAVAVCDQDGS